jgi:hypothetical protein
MHASTCSLVLRPIRAKDPPRRRRVTRREQRERILRARVAYMLWVMANRIE